MKSGECLENSAKKRSCFSSLKKYKHVYIILLPTLLYYIIFKYLPMFGNVMAFQDFKITRGFAGSEFVGLQNFRDFLTSYKFWQLLRNTLSINGLLLLFSFPAPIILALLLNEIKAMKFKKIVQTITYMPHFISTVVICSMILTMVSSEGLVNSVITMFGGEKISFMSDSDYFYPIYIISDIWQGVGWSSIIYIAALSSVDVQLYEAASIDGAGKFRQMIHVTLPCIVPTIVILLIMQIGNMLTIGYEKILLLYNPTIWDKADVISTYVYRRALLDGEYGYSAAVGIFNSVINCILLFTANSISRKVSDSSLF